MAKIRVQELMDRSGVRFGTSGARGLAEEMTDFICYIYTRGFLQYLESLGELKKDGTRVAIGGDLRPSTPRIKEAVRRAVTDMGYLAVNCGELPSPAIALYGILERIPAIMVTGSHIPEDRNGIKFNKCSGEILKDDEAGIRAQEVEYDESQFTSAGKFVDGEALSWPVNSEAVDMYVRRYLDFWGPDTLEGLKVLVYQHSAVGRDIVLRVLQGLGADVEAVGRSEVFIPVDTEAIREEDVRLARELAQERKVDAIVSTDGDSDRPLVADEHGVWLRGDVAGILAAKYLGADSVSTPVSCNTAVEKCGFFKEVRRTRIGSPYVIASMMEASAAGARMVVGYEANGGFLTNSDLEREGKRLGALPTRDALILIISILHMSKQRGVPISALVKELPARFTASDRLKNFPQEKSQKILTMFSSGDEARDRAKIEEVWGELCGKVKHIDRTDGVRITFENDEVIHLRPSGNAPEFRCYNEAGSMERVQELNRLCMKRLETMNAQ
ncbi:MAG: phosphomannomutase [Lentisphaerae bacterium]|nr:MAG: phosphomannomutase [Lentisphaerota bacterium]